MNGWIGVDLDGTLAEYTTWQGLTHIGKAVPDMVDRIHAWLGEGIEVRIFTARLSGDDHHELIAFLKALQLWLKAAGLPADLRVTNVKDFNMLELYDDRAVQVEINTGRLIGFSTRERGLE